MLKDCPFCGSSKIKYSIKTKGKYYHACFYCDNCHTYGPRVLSEYIDKNAIGYSARYKVANDQNLKDKALDAWNNRTMLEMRLLSENLRNIYAAERYQPSAKVPIKHTMVIFLLDLIDRLESEIANGSVQLPRSAVTSANCNNCEYMDNDLSKVLLKNDKLS